MLYSNKKVLLVTSDFVYPPNHGDRVDIWNRILCLKKMGFEIDLVCTVKKQPLDEYIKIVKQYINKLFLVKRKNNLIDMLFKEPLQMKSRYGLKKIKFVKSYDYVLLQGTYVFPIKHNKTLKYKKIFLRMNNDESIYFKGLGKSSKNFLSKIYYYMESYKFKYIDKKIVKEIPNILFVSYEEMENYKRYYFNIRAYFLPTAVEEQLKRRELKYRNVIFIGSLFMVNNKEAIEYYIENIHPLLMDIKDYNLIIAGNSKEEGIKWIEKMASKYKNIEIIDSPKTLDSIYEKATVFINPMLHGAGVKLKTINAIVNGMPVVSTTIGNQGTGLKHGKHIYIADDIEKYVYYIRLLLEDKEKRIEIVKNGQEYIKENYNQEKCLTRIFQYSI